MTSLAPHIQANRREKAKRLLAKYLSTKPTKWAEVDSIIMPVCNRALPPEYKTGPISYSKFSQFLEAWTKGVFDSEPPHLSEIILPQSNSILPPNVFGQCVLFPEQWDTFSKLYPAYKDGTIVGALQNGSTGCGKTFLALAIIHAFAIKDKLHDRDIMHRLRMIPYVVFTRKGLVRQWRDVVKQMGLSDLLKKGKLQIVAYSELSSSSASKWVSKEFDSFQNKYVYKWNLNAVPLIAVFDECAALCNPDTIQTRAFIALLNQSRQLPCLTLLMSATPADTVSKAGSFITSFRKPILLPKENGSVESVVVRSPEDWQKEYAFRICDEPTKSNNAAMKRLREIIDPYVFEIENVRWPARARNRSLVCEFHSQEDRTRYDQSYRRYQEKLHKLGRTESNSPFQQWIAFAEFHKAVEPVRNYDIAQRIKHNLSLGVATVVGHKYKASVTDLVFTLESMGIKRNNISIIWGGGKDYDEGNTFSEQELNRLVECLKRNERLSKGTINRMKHTIQFRQEMLAAGDTEADRYERYNQLRLLGMTGSQSPDLRWDEVTRFQTGVTKICIFTLAAGGVGLSLDRNKPELWPRELLAGLCLSGPDFKQVLGRLVRRGTMPGYVDQYMTFMHNTVEDKVLLPLIERKLSNIKELSTRGIDPTEILMDDEGTIIHDRLSINDLNRIADSDESQIKGDGEDEFEDDETETTLAI